MNQNNFLIKTIIIFFCFTLCSFSQAIYDGTGAAEYGDSWCSTFNNYGACYKVYTNDCANFVSQCLIEGGGMDLSGGSVDACGCIVNAGDLESFLESVNGITTFADLDDTSDPELMANASVGDVIVFHGTTNHATIISSVEKNGGNKTIYLDAHSSGQCALLLEYMYSGSFTSFTFLHNGSNVGFNDYVKIPSGTTPINYPGGNVTYVGQFVDADGSGSTANSWDWSLSFLSDKGTYIVASATGLTTGDPWQYSWTVNVGTLPNGYNWSRNSNGQIMGKVTVGCWDSDGYYHSAEMDISYNDVPPNNDFVYKTISTAQPNLTAHNSIQISNSQILSPGSINFIAGSSIYIYPETNIASGSWVTFTINPSQQ
jgi:hypothetical protein